MEHLNFESLLVNLGYRDLLSLPQNSFSHLKDSAIWMQLKVFYFMFWNRKKSLLKQKYVPSDVQKNYVLAFC